MIGQSKIQVFGELVQVSGIYHLELDQSPRNPVDLWIPGDTMSNLAAKIAMRDRVHATDHEECG